MKQTRPLFFLVALVIHISWILLSCQNTVSINQNDINGGPVVDTLRPLPQTETFPDTSYWRSELYPDDWTPDYSPDGSMFLHDFSYAGYRKGEYDLPEASLGDTVDVTRPPYNADNTGTTDSTGAIQEALDDVGLAGGGIVYLPPGTYRISPPSPSEYQAALRMQYDNVILRGAGADQTYILNTSTFLRKSSVIRIQPAAGSTGWNFWDAFKINEKTITAEYAQPTTDLEVSDNAGLELGDWIIVAEKSNEAMISDLDMTGVWSPENPKGPRFLRRITAISGNTVSIDIPTRFPILGRYEPTIFQLSTAPLEYVGLEHFSIGNIQNPKSGDGEEDYNTAGTMAYEVHGSHVIDFRFTVNSWARSIETFRPAGNSGDYHVLSNMMRFYQTRGITAVDCILQKPQYEGGGGNGYMFTLEGNDNLITNCEAVHSRHNYDFKYMHTSGNVITNSISRTPKYASDFHMYLSMANLFDAMTLYEDYIGAVWRPWGNPIHGQVTTESVIWNTTGNSYMSGKNYIVQTQQWGKGYVIGTQGSAYRIEVHSDNTGEVTAPADYIEGEGAGATLFPQSLYESMLIRRRIRESE